MTKDTKTIGYPPEAYAIIVELRDLLQKKNIGGVVSLAAASTQAAQLLLDKMKKEVK